MSTRGASTRDAILEAAYRRFLLQGYHGTSMRQVARDAGISPAAIYNHFQGKEALYTALLTQRIPQRALVKALSAARGESAEALIHDAMQRMRATMQNRFDDLRLMFIELLEFQGRHIGSIAEEFLPEALVFIGKVQQANGRLRPFPAVLVLRAFGGLFMSYAITTAFLSQVPGFQDDPDDLRALVGILLHGLLEAETD
jgi:AcrR family transcriptional regulator